MSVGVTVGAVSADTSSTNKNSALSAASTISGKSQPPSSSEQVPARKREMSGHTALRRDETVVETYRRM